MASHAARGKQLIDEKKYDEAIAALTTALKESPTSPDYLNKRAMAYQRNLQFHEALSDANAAVVHAHKRAKRELIVDAQLRRGIILFHMERYGDARLVFDIVKRMNKDSKEIGLWSYKIEHKAKTLPEDDERWQVTAKEIPELDLGSQKAAASEKASSNTNGSTTTNGAATSKPAPLQQTPVDKIRHDWYQNNQNVYLTLLAKGVPKDHTQVDITDRSMTITFPVAASDTTYDFTLDPLYASVIPDKCITNVFPSKVEIVLAKATPGQKWHSLESSEPVTETATSVPASTADIPHRTVLTAAAPSGPAYPTSSKSGPKNWDKFGDDDEEEEGGDPNAFFKKLYSGASPEAQRAMMKSYTESNGTSLSTNWDEVSKGKVETLPPDGMEAKSWGK